MGKNFENVIIKLIKSLPNDMELGREIRKEYVKHINKKKSENLNKDSNKL